jgi:hypothetical protein
MRLQPNNNYFDNRNKLTDPIIFSIGNRIVKLDSFEESLFDPFLVSKGILYAFNSHIEKNVSLACSSKPCFWKESTWTSDLPIP